MNAHGSSRTAYFYVFGALLFFTALTTAVAYADLGAMNNVVALGIAVTKALLVALFFMHLREEAPLKWVFMAVCILFLIILFSFSLGDYLTRGWQRLPMGWV